MICPLCSSSRCIEYGCDNHRSYALCEACDLVFVPESMHLSEEAEKKRYDLHDNSMQNPGYVAYLSEIAQIVAGMVSPDSRVLDFGAGKNGVLASVLRSKGFGHCDSYDPLYGIGCDCLKKKYDLIVLCEVVEHLRDLKKECGMLNAISAEKGIVIVRTNMRPLERNAFLSWWYKEDPTHISFFSPGSLGVFASNAGFAVKKELQKNLLLFTRKKSGNSTNIMI